MFSNNCHSHVVHVLNELEYMGRNDWNIIELVWLIVFKGKYTNFGKLQEA